MYFSSFFYSKYHKSITPPPQCDFFEGMYFFLWSSIFCIYPSIYFLNNLNYCRQQMQGAYKMRTVINTLIPESD